MFVKSLIVASSLALTSSFAFAGLEIGKKADTIDLSEKAGGRVDGTPWSSSEIKDKVFVLFYVDPDVKDLNEDVADAIKAKEFPADKFLSIAVINMAATWKPNFLISKALKEKQEKFPRTTYVKDMNKSLVNTWGLSDDNYCVVLFNQKGEVIFRKDGKFTEQEKNDIVSLIEKTIQTTPAS